MELHYYLAVLRRRLWIVIVAILVLSAIGYAVTSREDKYSTNAVVYVGARQFNVSGPGQYSYDPTLVVARLMETYRQMLDSEPIAQEALKSTNLQRSASDVVKHTSVETSKETVLLTVSVTDRQPTVARDLANAISDAFVDKVQSFETGVAPTEGTLPGLPAYVFERAKLPTVPDSSGLIRNVMIGGVLGLLISVGIVFLLEYLDLTLKSPGEAERRLELPVLGVIPLFRESPRGWSERAPSVPQRPPPSKQKLEAPTPELSEPRG